MADHTPGPWSVEIEDHKAPDDWYSAAIGVGSAWGGTYRTLARVPQSEHGWSAEVQAREAADARLMAAAPELLAALIALEGDCWCPWHAEPDHHTAPCLQARAAIAKARGEASRD